MSEPAKAMPPDLLVTQALTEVLGETGFNQKVRIEVSGDALHWLTNLAVQGYKVRKKEWESKDGGMDMGEQMSLASFLGNFEELYLAVKAGKKVKPAKRK